MDHPTLPVHYTCGPSSDSHPPDMSTVISAAFATPPTIGDVCANFLSNCRDDHLDCEEGGGDLDTTLVASDLPCAPLCGDRGEVKFALLDTCMAEFDLKLSPSQADVLTLQALLKSCEATVLDWKAKHLDTLSQLEGAHTRNLTESQSTLYSPVGFSASQARKASHDSPPTSMTAEKYERLLRLTLSARREAREWKKMAAYWEARVRQGEAFRGKTSTESITPSASDVSYVAEPLAPERAKAVAALVRRRRGDDVGGMDVASESVLEKIGEAMRKCLGPSDSTDSTASSSSSSSTSTVRASTVVKEISAEDMAASTSVVSSTSKVPAGLPGLQIPHRLRESRLSPAVLTDVRNIARPRSESLLKTPTQKNFKQLSSAKVCTIVEQIGPMSPKAMRGITARKVNHARSMSRERAVAMKRARNLLALVKEEGATSPALITSAHTKSPALLTATTVAPAISRRLGIPRASVGGIQRLTSTTSSQLHSKWKTGQLSSDNREGLSETSSRILSKSTMPSLPTARLRGNTLTRNIARVGA